MDNSTKPSRLTRSASRPFTTVCSPRNASAFARAAIDLLILSVWAAGFAASMVHSFAHSKAFLIDSAIKFPAVAPFTMLAVMPSIPADAPCAAFDAACSMLDRPVLTLSIEAFAC